MTNIYNITPSLCPRVPGGSLPIYPSYATQVINGITYKTYLETDWHQVMTTDGISLYELLKSFPPASTDDFYHYRGLLQDRPEITANEQLNSITTQKIGDVYLIETALASEFGRVCEVYVWLGNEIGWVYHGTTNKKSTFINELPDVLRLIPSTIGEPDQILIVSKDGKKIVWGSITSPEEEILNAIKKHNEDETAHTAIRQSIDKKANKSKIINDIIRKDGWVSDSEGIHYIYTNDNIVGNTYFEIIPIIESEDQLNNIITANLNNTFEISFNSESATSAKIYAKNIPTEDIPICVKLYELESTDQKKLSNITLPAQSNQDIDVYTLTKNSTEIDDDTLLSSILTPKNEDIAIITTEVEDVEYQKSVYIYKDEWVALTGTNTADKIILTDDIKINETPILSVKGETLMTVLAQIMEHQIQPFIISNPTIEPVSLSTTGLVESGTKIDSITIGEIRFNPGSYSYGPPTNINISNLKIERLTDTETIEIPSDLKNVTTDNNNLNGFTFGDQEGDVSELKYRITISYSDGVVANDKLNNESKPPIRINAGTVVVETKQIKAYRKYFYGCSTETKSSPDNDFIRSLINSTDELHVGKTINIQIPKGSKTICIAYPASFQDLSTISNNDETGTDISSKFIKSDTNIDGANGYAPLPYKLYTYASETEIEYNSITITI